jgi:hypothetical protein
MRITKSDIETVLNEEDIEGLLKFGAPNDEYSDEARMIASILQSSGDSSLLEDRTSDIVCQVWTESFGPFSEDDIRKRLRTFQNVAHRICKINNDK